MLKILVTGASGFIGSNLIRCLIRDGNEINIITRESSKLWRLNDVIDQCNNFVSDLINRNKIEDIVKKTRPDVVYHCATYGVNPRQQNPTDMINSNILCSINLLQILSEIQNCKIINLGTSLEYGSKNGIISEEDSEKPNTLYGISKLAQTNYFSYFGMKKKLDITTFRVFSSYGMYEDSGHIISDIMNSLIKGTPIKIRSLTATRDFIFIEDVVNALTKAANTINMPNILNLGSGKAYSIKEVLEHAKEIDTINVSEEVLDDEFERVFDTGFANIEGIKAILKWAPRYSLREGLRRTYEWLIQNRDLYDKVSTI